MEESLLFKVRRAMSFCSGYGTSDMARAAVMRTVNSSTEMIGADDYVDIQTAFFWEKNLHCHQLLADHWHWSNAVMADAVFRPQPCTFTDMRDLVPEGSYDPDGSFLERYFQLRPAKEN